MVYLFCFVLEALLSNMIKLLDFYMDTNGLYFDTIYLLARLNVLLIILYFIYWY